MAGQEALEWRGQKMVDGSGGKVGKIDEIYLDQETEQPEWALVNTGGMFGSASTFVPLAEATESDGTVTVPYDKATIKDAPGMEADGELSQDDEERLYRHYGLDYEESRSDSGLPEGDSGHDDQAMAGTGVANSGGDRDFDRESGERRDRTGEAGVVGQDTSGPTTDDAMTRSEEELHVGTQRRQTGTARLRKYVDTERVRETVPVEHEEVRVEREPVTDANMGAATTGGELTEEEHEVTLTGEEVDVDKRVVPKERIRLDKDTVRENVQVNEELRKEQVEVEGAGDAADDVRRDDDTADQARR